MRSAVIGNTELIDLKAESAYCLLGVLSAKMLTVNTCAVFQVCIRPTIRTFINNFHYDVETSVFTHNVV